MRVNGRTFYAISKDAKDNKIWLADEDYGNPVFLAKKLKLMDIEVDAFLINNPEKESCEVKCYGLDELETCWHPGIIIIYLGDDYPLWYKKLSEKGLSEGWDFKWIKRYGHDRLTVRYAFDPILGFNTVGNDERYPGYMITGNPDDRESKRIVILGGSASDGEVFNIKSWPECLWEVAKENGKNYTVFNGATIGYTCSQELVKIERDLMALEADIVISFSGMNNNHLVHEHPFFIDYNLKVAKFFEKTPAPSINMRPVLPFRAIRYSSDKFDKYAFWLNQEKTMHYFCGLYGVPFIGILEPNLMSKDLLLPEEKEYLMNRSFMGRFGLTPQGYADITRKYKDVMKEQNEGWLIDFSDIFDEEEKSVYFDALHVTEHGNRIIAENVYKVIKDLI